MSQLSRPASEDMTSGGPDGGMPTTDDQYSTMVANLLGTNRDINSSAPGARAVSRGDPRGSRKRAMDVAADDDRELKRSRFEVLE